MKKAKTEAKINTLYCGDNLEVMQMLPDAFVDLVYLDPPFLSNRHYAIIWGGDAENGRTAVRPY
jgi:DNA modification methylase